MTLKTDLEAAAVTAGNLEAEVVSKTSTINQLNVQIQQKDQQIATLTQQLADCQGSTPPPPLTPVTVSVSSGGVVDVNPNAGATVVIKNSAGATVYTGGDGGGGFPTGTYNWSATANSGFVLSGAISGQFSISTTPPPPPPPTVNEPFPANPAVVLSPGANVQSALASGKIVELKAGPYGDQRLNVPGGSYVFCRNGRAEFKHPHAGKCKDHPFCTQGGADVTLRGIIIDGYSAIPKTGTNYEGAGAIWLQSGMSRWSLLDIDFKNIFDTCVRGGGGVGHRMERYTATNVGRYVVANFSGATFKNGVCKHIADGVGVPKAADSDRGWSKFAADSKDNVVDGLVLEDIGGAGVWWDGRGVNGTARNIKGTRVSGHLVIAEVSYGPFLIENIESYDSHNLTTTPMKYSIVLCHWTPDMTVKNVYGKNVGNGVTAHAYDRTDASQEPMRSKVGNHRLVVDGLELEGVSRYCAGWAGRSGDYLGRNWQGMVWRNGKYPTGAKFRVGSQEMNLSQWLASPYGE